MIPELLSQREREVYMWEKTHVDRLDHRALDDREVRGVVSYVWSLCRLPGKPLVVRRIDDCHPEFIENVQAYVTPTEITLQEPCSTRVILHELAHTLTEDPLDSLELRALQESECHGHLWLTNYVWLLDRLMGPSYNTFHLRSTMPPILRPEALTYHPVIWGKPRSDL